MTQRKFPYPYKAMVGISSDIDDTTDTEFTNTHKWCNTENQVSSWGSGVGLDIADSFYFYGNAYNYPSEVSWLSDNPERSPVAHKRDDIVKYFNCGWIDTQHSFGDVGRSTEYPEELLDYFKRSWATQAYQEMAQYGVHSKIWLDHEPYYGSDPSFYGYHLWSVVSYDTYGGVGYGGMPPDGAIPTYVNPDGASCYHADLTRAHGIKYLWTHDWGGPPWGQASIITPITLADGVTPMIGFVRAHTEGTHYITNFETFAAACDSAILEGNLFLWYTHLGWATADTAEFQNAMRYARQKQDAGELLVARSVRLLDYNLARDYVNWNDVGATINITAINDPVTGPRVPTLDEVRGLTWYVDDPQTASISINGSPIQRSDLMEAPSDGTGKSIGIRWFDYDRTDYTVETSQDPTKVGSLQPLSLSEIPQSFDLAPYIYAAIVVGDGLSAGTSSDSGTDLAVQASTPVGEGTSAGISSESGTIASGKVLEWIPGWTNWSRGIAEDSGQLFGGIVLGYNVSRGESVDTGNLPLAPLLWDLAPYVLAEQSPIGTGTSAGVSADTSTALRIGYLVGNGVSAGISADTGSIDLLQEMYGNDLGESVDFGLLGAGVAIGAGDSYGVSFDSGRLANAGKWYQANPDAGTWTKGSKSIGSWRKDDKDSSTWGGV